MASNNFNRVMDTIFRHEGGYVDHPRDPGGATKYGITHLTLASWRGQGSVSKTAVKNLTKKEAKEIYKARYWNKVRADELPPGLDMVTMDGAVNSGPSRGVKWLQRGVGTKADGIVGAKTLAAARTASVNAIERACAARMGFLQGLRHWDAFGRGWSRRVAETEAVATKMWHSAAGSLTKKKMEEKVESAAKQATRDKAAGSGQAGSVASGGAAGGFGLADQPELLIALGVFTAVVVLFVFFRSRRRVQYQHDRAAAFRAIMEKTK